jgi:hypothetical protein
MGLENEEGSVPDSGATQDAGGLAAGFNKVRGNEPPADTSPAIEQPAAAAPEASTEVSATTATTTATTEDATATAQAEAAATTEEEPVIGGFKQSEFRALLAKAQRVDDVEAKLHGKIGELTRTLKAIQDTPAGKPVQITADNFKELKEHFPEMAEMITQGLNGLMLGGAPSAPNPAEFQQLVDQQVAVKLTEHRQETAKTLLSMKHPDWHPTVNSDDFRRWMEKLPEADRARLNNSWEPAFVSEKIDQFKARAAEQPPTAPRKNSEKRLASAVTPQGVPNAGPTTVPDSAGLSAGFSKVRRVTP